MHAEAQLHEVPIGLDTLPSACGFLRDGGKRLRCRSIPQRRVTLFAPGCAHCFTQARQVGKVFAE